MIIKHYDKNGNMAITIAPEGVSYTIEKVNEDQSGMSYVVKMAATSLSKPILLAEAEKIISFLYKAILSKKDTCDLTEGS